MKKFFMYLCRWELSTFILAPCIAWLGFMGEWPAAIIANAIGACIFFWVDFYIFRGDKK